MYGEGFVRHGFSVGAATSPWVNGGRFPAISVFRKRNFICPIIGPTILGMDSCVSNQLG